MVPPRRFIFDLARYFSAKGAAMQDTSSQSANY
jgi:hypothetical protein